MAWFASSDPFVVVAWGAALATFSLSAALTVQVLRVRRATARREVRRDAFLAAWRPRLFEAAMGGNPPAPPVEPPDLDAFIALWNDVMDALDVESRAALGRVAEGAGADAEARRRLVRGRPVEQVQALRLLGHLGRPDDFDAVHAHLDDPRAYLSLTAARALVRIDPARAPAAVVPRIARRQDWPASLLVTALSSAAPAAVGRELERACAGAPAEQLVRLLPLVEVVERDVAEEILFSVLAPDADPEVIASVLRHARTPGLVGLAREGCLHPSWAVRTQAASALGRIGTPPDRDRLLALLRDGQWWVRYRAAQALCTGRFGPPASHAADVVKLADRYAADIFAHVLAEGRA
ncbi:MAG: HEAT repeat domain-containing protein [Anaeromyxobacteraceae bacterium]